MGETIPLTEDVKGFGYGRLCLWSTLSGGKRGSAVLSSMRVQHGFGHDHFSDRARILIWQNFDLLQAAKARSISGRRLLYRKRDADLLGRAKEYFLLMEKVEGKEYFFDLERVKEKGGTDLDYKGSPPWRTTLPTFTQSRTTARLSICARSGRPWGWRMHLRDPRRLSGKPRLSGSWRAMRCGEALRGMALEA